MSIVNITGTTDIVLRIIVTVFHVFAFLTTCFRLGFRYYIQRVWWEDSWAAIAMFLDVMCLAALWVLEKLDTQPDGFSSLPKLWVIAYTSTFILCPCVIWSSRMGIIFSVIRITPPSSIMRRLSYVVVVLFSIVWLCIVVVVAYLCRHASWALTSPTQPSVSFPIAYVQSCVGIVADIILVILPIRLLWRVKLPKNERMVILSIFSSSILASIMSIVHAIYLFPNPSFTTETVANLQLRLSFGLVILSNFQAALSLVICNLLVVVTFLYRIIRNGEVIETDYATSIACAVNTALSPPSANNLTTIDLDYLVSEDSSVKRTDSTRISTGSTRNTSASTPPLFSIPRT